MTLESQTDKSACPADQAGLQESTKACKKILADGSRSRGNARTSDHKTSPAPPESLSVNTDGLYPGKKGPVRLADANHTFDARPPSATDRTAHPPKLPIFESIDFKREVLLKEAARVLPEKEAVNLKRDMDEFEKRAKNRHLPDSEVYQTYESAYRLLHAGEGGSTSVANMQRLAEQMVHLAAHPPDVRQGNNNTCEMASLEFVLYSKNPSVAADVVAQSALRGSYRTKDGIEVEADAIPTYESEHYRRSTGGRLYASQVFQTTAINVGFAEEGGRYHYHAETGRVPDGHPEKGGYVYDYQTGDRLNFKNSDDVYATDAYYGMTGRKDLIVIESGRPDPNLPNVLRANTPQQFNQIMRDLKKKDQFPVMVGLDLQNQPFWNDSWDGSHDPKKRYLSFDGHDLAVTDFHDGALPMVSLHNNWTPEADRRDMSAKELFLATRPARQNLGDLQKQYDATVAHGKPDYILALDILRLRAGFRQIDADELGQELMKTLKRAIDQQGISILSLPILRNEYNEIAAIVQAQGRDDPAKLDPELWKRVQRFFEGDNQNQ